MTARNSLPARGAVLGVDIGWSLERRTSAACRLEWDRTAARLTACRFTAAPGDVAGALGALTRPEPFLAAALDGPLRGALDEIGAYRHAEAMLTLGFKPTIGKPGQASSGNGRKLNNAANAVARLLADMTCMRGARHKGAIHALAIVEAFPTSFLGTMLESGFGFRPMPRSDAYYRRLTEGADHGGGLAALLRGLLPGRALETPLAAIRDHDERAAAVCAVTALCVAAQRYTAVGCAANGYIILPPRAGTVAKAGLQDWAWAILRDNQGRRAGAELIEG